MTLSDLEWSFYVKLFFFAGMSIALKPCFRSLATFKLAVNVGEQLLQCGIARFPCDSTDFWFGKLSCHDTTFGTLCYTFTDRKDYFQFNGLKLSWICGPRKKFTSRQAVIHFITRCM